MKRPNILLFIRPPGAARPRRDRRGIAGMTDLHATLLDYAGLASPADGEGRRSLRAMAETADDDSGEAFCTLCAPDASEGQAMLARGKWKLVANLDGRRMDVELYDRTRPEPDGADLAADPANAGVARELRERLETRLRQSLAARLAPGDK